VATSGSFRDIRDSFPVTNIRTLCIDIVIIHFRRGVKAIREEWTEAEGGREVSQWAFSSGDKFPNDHDTQISYAVAVTTAALYGVDKGVDVI
jgi:hypothetical protein